MATTPESPYAALKRLFHEPHRMALVTALCAHDEGCTFGELKAQCDLTDGNLNRHLKALAEAGVVRSRKVTRPARGCTRIRVTNKGREQFMAYLQSLEDVLRHTARALAAQEPVENNGWLWQVNAVAK